MSDPMSIRLESIVEQANSESERTSGVFNVNYPFDRIVDFFSVCLIWVGSRVSIAIMSIKFWNSKHFNDNNIGYNIDSILVVFFQKKNFLFDFWIFMYSLNKTLL
jgi:hypothetical protein